MFTEGIIPIGDGLLDIEEERLKSLLVPDDINEIYEVEQTPFARGKFAAVRRAIHKNSGVHFAAKFLKRRRRAQSSDKEIKHEIAVLTLCNGADNIVKLNAVHESRSDTALLLELAHGGELQTFLDNEECLSEAQARYCMREVLKALQFLHKRSIAHLDLKPQNILLTGEHIEDGLKLCDFGISRIVTEGTNVREICGTPDYVAPEVLQYEPLSLLTDIWSVGVLTYVLLSGFSPFGGDSKQETFLNISQCALTFPDKLFGGVSTAAIDFIRRALRIKPNERMSAAGCLEHSWLKDECQLGRQLYCNSKQSKAENGEPRQTEHQEDSDEVDDGIDECNGDDDDDDEDVESLEEEEDEISTDDNVEDMKMNGDSLNKMITSDTEQEQPELVIKPQQQQQQQQPQTPKAHITNGFNKITNGTIKKKSITPTAAATTTTTTTTTKKNPTITTTTAVHTLPATRATTIPLLQQQTQQQRQQQRRHSTDSNKENNTYLASKKIIPMSNNKKSTLNGGTKGATSTATIIITPSNSVSTNGDIAPPTATHHHQHQCLFPDAPTTPKVIRKAPTTETSPTSVKALVKKFQLEGKDKKLQQQRELLMVAQTAVVNVSCAVNGVTGRKSIANGEIRKKIVNGGSDMIPNGCRTTTPNNMNGTTTSHTTAAQPLMRRASEPLAAVHLKKSSSSATRTTTTTTTTTTSSSPTRKSQQSSIATTTATLNSVNYKSSCVLCLNCGSNTDKNSTATTSSSTGCRHSVVTTTPTATSSNNSTNCNSNNSSAPSTPTSTASASAAAILLQHHHLQQHHHHHHHHKSHATTANLSLDQGIIC